MKSAVIPMNKNLLAGRLEEFSYDIHNIAWLSEASAKKSPRDVMDNFKVLVMISGSAKVHIGHNIYYTKSGDCLFFAPGSIYYAQIDDGVTCQFAAINFSVSGQGAAHSFAATLGIKDILVFPRLVEEQMAGHIQQVYAGQMENQVDRYYDVLLILKRLVAMAVYKRKSAVHSGYYAPAAEETVLRCHRHIINNLSADVTVDSLCRLCNVSQSYLYRCFKSVFGISAKEFILKTRLEHAAALLTGTDKSVGAVAADCGFSSGYRFSAAFKKWYGQSPTSYRKLHAKK